MKKILALGIIGLTIFIIYLITLDKKIYYVALGDTLTLGYQNNEGNVKSYADYVNDYLKEKNISEKYIKDFSSETYRTTDLIRDIEDNKKININNKELTLKNALIKADLVTLSIGANDIIYKLGLKGINNNIENVDEIYNYIDDILIDLEKLFILLREYCKEEIIIIGYYNPLANVSSEYARTLEPLFLYTNQKLNILCKKYNMHYVDIYTIFKENPEFIDYEESIYPLSSGYEAIAKEVISTIDAKMLK